MSNDLNDKVITVVVLKPSTETTDQLVKAMTANPSVEVITVDTPSEAVQLLTQMQPGIVIASLPDSKAVVSTMTLLKGIFPLAKRGRVKSIVISKQSSLWKLSREICKKRKKHMLLKQK